MKYGFEDTAKKQIEEEAKRKITKMIEESKNDGSRYSRLYNQAEEESSRIGKILEIINSCHYPEFKGLRLLDNSIEVNRVEPSLSDTKLTLINVNGVMYDVNFERSNYMSLSDSAQELVIRYYKASPSWLSQMYVSFVIGNDVAIVSIDKANNFNIEISVYTDAAPLERDKGKPVGIVPDFNYVIPKNSRDGIPYYDTTPISQKVSANDVSLYEIRKIATNYVRKCHEMLDDLELYPEERTR